MAVEVTAPKPARKNTKGAPADNTVAAEHAQQHGHTDKGGPNKDHLNFKPGAEFKREYQMFAAAHGMSMVDMLKESFDLLKKAKIGGQ
ncbi:hypothetical protein GHO35_13550 [Pseudomonas helleri]|uniref:hypothetical protein n=1 Tax=Pseudomonas helleri TaxID=1608996 RepID=UPI001296D2AF|nr:hypothetical protein [Pseudomonas helleri]MQU22165.1 hypothetical protein [Pseudomonas helleri]